MSYYRPVRVEELVAWLLEKGYAEEEPGFGHVDAQALAEALTNKFDMLFESKTAT